MQSFLNMFKIVLCLVFHYSVSYDQRSGCTGYKRGTVRTNVQFSVMTWSTFTVFSWTYNPLQSYYFTPAIIHLIIKMRETIADKKLLCI